MEEIVIFRIFLMFPLIGLVIPKAGILFEGAKGSVSVGDIIIATTIIISMIICSIGISLHKRRIGTVKESEPLISW
ncbi:hypothetical protein [Mucilaginibacter sp.]